MALPVCSRTQISRFVLLLSFWFSLFTKNKRENKQHRNHEMKKMSDLSPIHPYLTDWLQKNERDLDKYIIEEEEFGTSKKWKNEEDILSIERRILLEGIRANQTQMSCSRRFRGMTSNDPWIYLEFSENFVRGFSENSNHIANVTSLKVGPNVLKALESATITDASASFIFCHHAN